MSDPLEQVPIAYRVIATVQQIEQVRGKQQGREASFSVQPNMTAEPAET